MDFLQPAFTTQEFTRGKLRVVLEYFDGLHDIIEYTSVDLVNMIDQMCVKIDPTITIPYPKPEVEPFTWARFIDRFKAIRNVKTTFNRWGNVKQDSWERDLRPGSDVIKVAIQEAGVYTLEYHLVYCEKLGNIGYVKLIIHPAFSRG